MNQTITKCRELVQYRNFVIITQEVVKCYIKSSICHLLMFCRKFITPLFLLGGGVWDSECTVNLWVSWNAIQLSGCIFFYRYPFQPDQKVAAHDWEIFLKETAKMIVQEQSPQKLLQIRSRLYELMIHGIPSEFIFKVRFPVLCVCFCFSNWLQNS
jgi:Clamp-loader complex subunit E C-terminus.